MAVPVSEPRESPTVSVLICTKDRRQDVARALASLRAAGVEREGVEIVVVEETARPAPMVGVRYVPLPPEGRGFAHVRNRAVDAAKGSVLVFVDDDCEVAPGWLDALLAPLADPEVAGVAGAVLVRDCNAIGYAESILGFPGGGLRYLAGATGAVVPTAFLSTCNCVYRRAAAALPVRPPLSEPPGRLVADAARPARRRRRRRGGPAARGAGPAATVAEVGRVSGRPGVSVVLITRNEAARIRRCLESVRWADEIVVVDQHSADGTPAICREYGARVVTRDMLAGFGDQKNFALAQATQPWILSLDADEEVTPALRREIETAVASPGEHAGFRMPRLTSYLGRFIRHCGWYPSPVLRLVRRGRGRFTEALVHEELLVNGPVGDLGVDLLHRSYDLLADHVRKLLLYAAYDARMLEQRGDRVGGLGALWRLAVKPPAVFVRKYVAQGGFREGWHGFVLSAMAALVVFVNYVRLAELTGWLPTPAEPGPAGEPPTVLLMANFADLVGGGEESLLALAARLDRHRIRPVASVPAEGDVAERLRALGVPVTVLPLPPVRPWRAAGMAWTLSRLRVLLAGERVALVHAQGGRGALYAALAARGRRTPVVWHARTADADRWLDPILARLAHTIIANSGATACRFRAWPAARVIVVPNGVDLGRFTPGVADPEVRRALGLPAAGRVVGYFGRLEHGQGPDVLHAAGERLQPKVPGVELLVVGEGPLPAP